MFDRVELTRAQTSELLGDPHPLVARIGAPPAPGSLGVGSSSIVGRVVDRASLRQFLHSYQQRILGPMELPAIYAAWGHASRGETRELIELDHRLGLEPVLQDFAAASRAVGRSQLRRLRPLRDQRFLRRYTEAVESGKAHGWHVLVFGVVLGVYSVPLRQGLLHYARHTLNGFIESAAGPMQLTAEDCEQTLAEVSDPLPATVHSILSRESRLPLLVC